MDNSELEKKLSNAKTKMLFQYRFFGILAADMKDVITDRFPTAATDGKRIFWNPEFLEKLSLNETVFVYGHELMHCAAHHMKRRGTRDHNLWNFATDYFINVTLKHQEFKKGNKIVVGLGEQPTWVLYDEKYIDWTADEIYKDLQQQGKGEGECLDTHLSPDEKANFDRKLKKAADAVKNQPGQVPAFFENLIDQFTESRIDWRRVIKAKAQAAQKKNQCFTNPSRRSWHQGVIFPGYTQGKKINVAVALDTSGSMSEEELIQCVSEVFGIMKQFDDFTLKVWCFDHQVHEESYKEFTSGNNPKDFKVIGRGGTSFGANWEFMDNHGIQADMLLVFTDGFCDFEGCKNTVDTVWCVTESKEFKPPFGVTCRIDYD